jgi:NADH:ubiquinone oxidoreductase subunit
VDCQVLDRACGAAYIRRMTTIGTRLYTMLKGRAVGTDGEGNMYYEERRPTPGLRTRRWVIYRGLPEATKVPPEWHAWLHHTTDAPIVAPRRPWQKPHLPNLTGTPYSYRPPGHDYRGGVRAAATGDYEAWTPDAPASAGEPRP